MKLGFVYLQQAQSLGLCIRNKHEAWGFVFASNTYLGVVYLQQHKAWGCVCATDTKPGAVYLQQPAMPELYVHAELALVLHWLA